MLSPIPLRYSFGFSKTHPFRLTLCAVLFVATGILLASRPAFANSETWTGGSSTDGNWSDTSNWSNAKAPGSTSVISSTDVATFSAAIANSWGAAANTVVIDSTSQNIGSITFTGSAGDYFLGSTSGNSLLLSNGGTIQLSNLTNPVGFEAINAPLVIEGANASYTFANNSGNGTLYFGGTITSATTGAITLNLTGANTTGNTISGNIANGKGTLSIVKSGAGTWALSGANSFTGNVTLNAGTLALDSATALGSAAAGGAFNINGGTIDTLAAGVAMTVAKAVNIGGSFAYGGTGNLNLGAGAITNNGDYTVAFDSFGRTLTLGGVMTNTEGTNQTTTVNGVGNTLVLGGYNLSNNSTPYIDTIQGSGNVTISGVVSSGSAATGCGLTYAGTGTLTLGGANTFTGPISVTSGTLKATNGSAFNPTAGGAVTVSAGASLTYAATSNTPLTLQSLSITGGVGTVLGASLGTSATGAEISVIGTASATGAVAVDVFGSTLTPVTGTYTLLAGGAGSSLNGATYTLYVYDNTNFTYGALSSSATSLTLPVTAATALGTAYWKGGLSGAPNVWAVSSGSSNWASTSGGAAQGLIPGSGANVTISSGSVNTAPTSTVLGANMTINSLTIADTVNGLGLNADGNTLTVNSGGITMNAGVPASLIGANVALGGNQTWTNNSANTLTVSGAISGASTLTIAGTGPMVLSGSNSSTGVITVNGGTALFINAGSVNPGGITVNIGTTVGTTLGASGTPFGSGPITLSNATLSLAPAGSGNNIAYTAANVATSTQFTYGGESTLALNKGSESSLTFTAGGAFSPLTRSGSGLLIINTSTGDLGIGTGGENFITTSAPTVTSGLVWPTIVGLGTDNTPATGGVGAANGDFLTYGANGFASASSQYTVHSTSFTTSSNEIADVTGNVTITNGGYGSQAYALLVQNGCTAVLNGTVLLGGGTLAGSSSQVGLILNGGNLSGGTLVFGDGSAEGVIYGFNAPSTISSNLLGAGGLTFGGNQTVTLSGYGNCPTNNYITAGPITVISGGVNITGAIGQTTPVNVSGGALNLGNANLITSVPLNVDVYSTSLLTESAANAITGNATLTVSTGTATLSQANNYIGATTLYGGTLNLNATGAINGSPVSVNGGALNITALNALTGASSLSANNYGTGGINIFQPQNYSGPTFIGAGETLNLSGGGSLTDTVINYYGALILGCSGAISGTSVLNTYAGSMTETAADAISGAASVNVGGNPFSMANNYSGTTNIVGGYGNTTGDGSGGHFTLEFNGAGAPLTNIINNGISHANIGAGSTLIDNGAEVEVEGASTAVANSQEFNGMTLNAGENSIALLKNSAASLSLILNAITRNSGATLDIRLPTGCSLTTTTPNANFTGGHQTILGGYATVGGNSWAVSGTGATAGPISALATAAYTPNTGNVLASGADIDMTVSGTTSVSASQTINSLRFNTAQADTISISSGALTIATGGILVSSNVGSSASKITGGSITSGNGQDLIVNDFDSSAATTINSAITNDGASSVGLTKSAPGTLILGGANTFTGQLTINSGSVELGPGGTLSGANRLFFGSNGGSATSFLLEGNSATIAGLNDSVAYSPAIDQGGNPGNFTIQNGSATTPATLTIDSNTNDSYDGAFINGSTAALSLTKSGAGTLTLSGGQLNGAGMTYTGATVINGGMLYITSNNDLLNSTVSVTVGSQGSIGSSTYGNIVGNTTTFTGMTVAGGGEINQINGIGGEEFLVIGGTAASTATLAIGDSTAAGIIGLDAGTNSAGYSVADSVYVSGGAGLKVGADGIVINLNGIGGNISPYAIILSTSAFAKGSAITSFTSSNVGPGGLVTLGTTKGNFDGQTVSLAANNSTSVGLSVSVNPTPYAAYFSGASGAGNAWNAFSGGNANYTNWNNADYDPDPALTGTNTGQLPGANGYFTDVYFGTAPTTQPALANYLNNTLGANFNIDSLNYLPTSGSNNITTSGPYNLTIGAGGINDSATGGTQTVAAMLITLFTSEIWTVSNAGDTLAVSSAIVDGALGYSLDLNDSQSGNGTLILTGTSIYSGGTIIGGGVLSTNLLANGGVASGIGASSNAAANLILDGGTLQYTGGATSTDRLFSISSNGGTIDASGSGPVNFTNTGAMGFFNPGMGPCTLTLTGSNTGPNTLSAVIADDGDGDSTSLTKAGAGKWVLTASSSYTGATTVTGGTLVVSGSLTGTTAINVDTGGTLLIAGAGYYTNLINPAAVTTLGATNGATLAMNNDGTNMGVTQSLQTLARLILSYISIIDMGNNITGDGNTLLFTGSTMIQSHYISLTIGGWRGNPYAVGATTDSGTNLLQDHLLFALNPGFGALGTPITSISFYNDNGVFIGNGMEVQIAGGTYDGDYELVATAVPEPGTWALLVSGAGMLAVWRRFLRKLGIERHWRGGNERSNELKAVDLAYRIWGRITASHGVTGLALQPNSNVPLELRPAAFGRALRAN